MDLRTGLKVKPEGRIYLKLMADFLRYRDCVWLIQTINDILGVDLEACMDSIGGKRFRCSAL